MEEFKMPDTFLYTTSLATIDEGHLNLYVSFSFNSFITTFV